MALRTFPAAGCLLLLAAIASEPALAVRLNSLSVSGAPLTPSFQYATFSYTATVGPGVAQVQVVAAPAGMGSTLTVNGLATSPGVPSAPIALAPGAKTIRGASTGRLNWWGPVTTHTYTIVVTRAGNNAPPSVDSVDASSPSAVFGTAITFTASASDPDQGDISASIAWASDREGSLGTGASITRVLTSLGAHTITATVTDAAGASASRTLAVTITNTAPVVGPLSVSAPEVERGTPVTFSGTAADDEDGDLSAALRWSSNRDGNLGTGASLTDGGGSLQSGGGTGRKSSNGSAPAKYSAAGTSANSASSARMAEKSESIRTGEPLTDCQSRTSSKRFANGDRPSAWLSGLLAATTWMFEPGSVSAAASSWTASLGFI